MASVSVLVHGLGNIGKNVIRSLETAPDMECLGVVRTKASLGTKKPDLRGLDDFDSLEALVKAKGRPDVAIICSPSRLVPDDARKYLAAGLHTVDSFDIHDQLTTVVEGLNAEAIKAGRVSITSAGWDPGTDSVMRALFEIMVPVGTTFTNFGRGRSMGHSAAARAIEGVADAVSLTIPLGAGRHSRLVYILPKSGAAKKDIKAAVAADDYFAHDPLEVRFVTTPAELAAVADNSHGVLMEHIGSSGQASNQRLSFDMRIDNPALTGQIMVSTARATTRLAPGCYTMLDIPLVAMLPGERMRQLARLV